MRGREGVWLPEVTQEALQVVGVAQLGLALVRPLPQAAPRLVQLGALLLEVLRGLWVGLDQALGCVPKGVHLEEGSGEKAGNEGALPWALAAAPEGCVRAHLVAQRR